MSESPRKSRGDHPPQLLVSVRNSTEAAAALEGGCQILDVKEPRQGSLGRATNEVIEDIKAIGRTAGVPVSAALGELAEWDAPHTQAPPTGLCFYKVGLAGAARLGHWVETWMALRDRLEIPPASWVGVAYADRDRAESPPIERIIDVAMQAGSSVVLLDTYRKDDKRVTDFCTPQEIAKLVHRAHAGGLRFALAGRVTRELLAELHDNVSPDIIAIRSAACETEDRNQTVSAGAVRYFVSAVASMG